jgi:TonB family protein
MSTERSIKMRRLFLLATLLVCLTSVNAFAQETTAQTEQPKNAVDRAVDEAKEHGEKVLGVCLMDCGDAKGSEAGENGQAIELPKPSYPPIARAAHAQGTVEVKVLVDTDGNVIAAAAISGHPLLQAASVSAARQARFTPMKYNGEPVKVVGVIEYHFVAQ